MTRQTITALYDRYEDAAAAVTRLHGIGIPDDDISIVANNEGDRYSSYAGSSRDRDDSEADTGAGTGATAGTLIGGGAGLLAGLGLLAIPGAGPVVAAGWLIATLTGAGVGAAAGGLVGALVGAGIPEEHAHSYAEGVRRGGTLVTVRAEDDHVDRAVAILDEHGSVDMEERERSWRSEGWTGLNEESGYTGGAGYASSGTSSAASYGAGSTGALGTAGTMGSTMGSTGIGSSATSASDRSSLSRDYEAGSSVESGRSGRSGDESRTIPIVEERLDVGKREVGGGRVRVHSHVVEKPVTEQVTLRQEHVDVERRPVDRPLTDRDAAFRDRTIEMEERSEEAVVSKEARVVEEVTIDKHAENRTQTVSDTVRRTEVEVDDQRTDGLRSGDRKRT